MKKIVLLTLVALMLASLAPVFGGEARIEHYAAEKPATAEDALALLGKKNAAIGNLLRKPKLGDSDLEAVHEASYGLEAAVDRLREGQKEKQEKILDRLDEAVQAMHYASENREEKKVRAWFAKIEAATKEAQSAFKS